MITLVGKLFRSSYTFDDKSGLNMMGNDIALHRTSHWLFYIYTTKGKFVKFVQYSLCCHLIRIVHKCNLWAFTFNFWILNELILWLIFLVCFVTDIVSGLSSFKRHFLLQIMHCVIRECLLQCWNLWLAKPSCTELTSFGVRLTIS